MKYIARGFLTMLGAILAVVLVYVLVQYVIMGDKKDDTESSAVSESTGVAANSQSAESEPGGIYLRELPLTDSQKSMAETFGVDVETYYISPDTINCAEESLGVDRYQAIVNGESPSLIEATKLMKCL